MPPRRHRSTSPALALALLAVVCHVLQLSHFVVVAHENGQCGGHGAVPARGVVQQHSAPHACVVGEAHTVAGTGEEVGDAEPRAGHVDQDHEHDCPFQSPSLDHCGGASVRVDSTPLLPVLAGVDLDSWQPAASRFALAPKQSPPVHG